MDRPSFSAPDLIYDLKTLIEKIRQEPGTHPADVNALLFGTLDGLSAGKKSITENIFTDYGGEIVILLVAYAGLENKSLRNLVENINKMVYFGDVLTTNNFLNAPSYGTSRSASYYRLGFEIAMSWSMKLYRSAVSNSIGKDISKSLALRHIEATNKTIANEL